MRAVVVQITRQFRRHPHMDIVMYSSETIWGGAQTLALVHLYFFRRGIRPAYLLRGGDGLRYLVVLRGDSSD